MSAVQPEPQPRAELSPERPSNAVAVRGHLSVRPLLGVFLALVGGAGAWTVLQLNYPMFSMPTGIQTGRDITVEQDAMIAAAIAKANRQNTLFALAVMGLGIGGALGIAEGIARRSLRAVIMNAVLVAVSGAVAGVVGGLLADVTYETVKPESDPLPLTGTIMMHLVSLSVLGSGIGLGLGASTGRGGAVGNCLMAGLLGGICAGLLYPIVLAFVLPGAQTEVLVPLSGGSRLLWIALFAALLGMIVPGSAGKRVSQE